MPPKGFICDAPVIEAVGFFSAEDARVHAKKRREYVRVSKEQAGFDFESNFSRGLRAIKGGLSK